MYDLFTLILRFVISFAALQAIAVAGIIFASKKHRSTKAWLAALGALCYLNCAYVFLFAPVGIRQQLGIVLDYALIYPFFAYILVCMALAPLFIAAAAVSGFGKTLAAFRPGHAASTPQAGHNGRRRDFLKMMTAGIALPVAAPSLYGMYVGSARLATDDVPVFFPDLPSGLEGFTIVQLSDIHVGPFMDSAMLQGIVRRINAMAPDMIAITGDIINWGSSYIDEAAEGLAGLQAEYGVYSVLGNHDFYCDTAQLCDRLEKKGLQVLRNTWRDIRLESGATLQLAGIDDPRVRRRRPGMHGPQLTTALQGAPEGLFRVLLSHRPDVFDAAARRSCRLILAGHTHAGQVISPFGNGRKWSLAKLFYERDYGLFELGGSRLYINRGLGVVGPPMRINCPREITRLVLHRAPA